MKPYDFAGAKETCDRVLVACDIAEKGGQECFHVLYEDGTPHINCPTVSDVRRLCALLLHALQFDP